MCSVASVSASASSNGANAIMNGLNNLTNNAQQSLQQSIDALNQSSNGILDPLQMSQLQMLSQNYLAEIQMTTSLVKQFGDIDKTVATNIGS